MTAQLAVWQGQFGNDYTKRNEVDENAREQLEIFWHRLCGRWNVTSALEVGANIGRNLRAIPDDREKYALEPNELARQRLRQDDVVPEGHIIAGTAQNIEAQDNSFDLVFTSGVLIHVPPDTLLDACNEIYRVSKRLILCIEYFADQPETKPYRGHDELMFKRDFGKFWMDNFDLKCLGYGFLWKETGDGDNTNWWLFEK